MCIKVIKNKECYGIIMNGNDLLEILPHEAIEVIESMKNGLDGEEIDEFFSSSNGIYIQAKEFVDVTDKDIGKVFGGVLDEERT